MTARRIACVLGLIVCVGLTSVWADEIIYLKGGKQPVKNKLTAISDESPRGITLKGGDKYSEADIEDIFHNVDGLPGLRYSQAYSAQKIFLDTAKDAKARNKAYDDLKKTYDEILPTIPDKRAKAHVEFTLGYLMALRAMEENSDPKNAIARLSAYVTANPKSWQVVRSLRMIAKLQRSIRDYPGEKATFTRLADLDVADDVKQDAMLQVAMADVTLGQFVAAEPKLAALLKSMPKDSPVYTRTQLALAECLLNTSKVDEGMAIFKKTVKESKDKTACAMAHNALGVALFNAPNGDKFKEARWEFLFVDVVYNQDKAEHAKALYYLSHTFEKLGDAAKAEERPAKCSSATRASRGPISSGRC